MKVGGGGGGGGGGVVERGCEQREGGGVVERGCEQHKTHCESKLEGELLGGGGVWKPRRTISALEIRSESSQ